jgi:hypothetical protein
VQHALGCESYTQCPSDKEKCHMRDLKMEENLKKFQTLVSKFTQDAEKFSKTSSSQLRSHQQDFEKFYNQFISDQVKQWNNKFQNKEIVLNHSIRKYNENKNKLLEDQDKVKRRQKEMDD